MLMKKLLARGLAAAVGVTAPAIALAQNYSNDYYDDYYDDYYYDDYSTVSDGTAAALGVGMMVFIGIIALLSLVAGIFVLWMIIDAARRDFDQKVMWILLMVFLGLIPAIAYFFMIKKKNVTGSGSKPASPAAGGQTPPAQPPQQPQQ